MEEFVGRREVKIMMQGAQHLLSVCMSQCNALWSSRTPLDFLY